MTAAPAEILSQLIRFDTTNPPGNEAACIGYVRELLQEAGVDAEIFALDPSRPNLLARVTGRGEAPALLLYGHVDVVPVGGQEWSLPPFAAEARDGYIWGRGAIDMKGGVAMLVSAFLRAAVSGEPPPGDLVLGLVADEEAGGVFGARFMVERHGDRFAGIKHALGEFGGFSMHLAGRRFYPVMVAEKQALRVIAKVRGPGGHGSLPTRGGAAARLGSMLTTLDSSRLPVHVTAEVRRMVEAIADNVDIDTGGVLWSLLKPVETDAALELLGPEGRMLDGLLHNTVNATVIRGGTRVNVIPSEIEVELDGRILPGQGPDDLMRELHALLGSDVELAYDQFDPGPPSVDLSAYEMLAGVLRDADPDAVPVPLVLTGVTDARFFSRLGIQTYGFLPMRFPAEVDFLALVHAADERIPAGEVAWGADRIHEAIQRYRG